MRFTLMTTRKIPLRETSKQKQERKMLMYEFGGKVKFVDKQQTFSYGFSKRDLFVEIV